MNAYVVDIAKVTVASIAFIIALIAFFLPLVKTYIPLWRINKKIPSHPMTFRLSARLALALLFLHEALFPLDRLLRAPQSADDPILIILRLVIIPLLAIIILLFVGNWRSHPDGIRGL